MAFELGNLMRTGAGLAGVTNPFGMALDLGGNLVNMLTGSSNRPENYTTEESTYYEPNDTSNQRYNMAHGSMLGDMARALQTEFTQSANQAGSQIASSGLGVGAGASGMRYNAMQVPTRELMGQLGDWNKSSLAPKLSSSNSMNFGVDNSEYWMKNIQKDFNGDDTTKKSEEKQDILNNFLGGGSNNPVDVGAWGNFSGSPELDLSQFLDLFGGF